MLREKNNEKIPDEMSGIFYAHGKWKIFPCFCLFLAYIIVYIYGERMLYF